MGVHRAALGSPTIPEDVRQSGRNPHERQVAILDFSRLRGSGYGDSRRSGAQGQSAGGPWTRTGLLGRHVDPWPRPSAARILFHPIRSVTFLRLDVIAAGLDDETVELVWGKVRLALTARPPRSEKDLNHRTGTAQVFFPESAVPSAGGNPDARRWLRSVFQLRSLAHLGSIQQARCAIDSPGDAVDGEHESNRF